MKKGGRERFLDLYREQTLDRARTIYGNEFDHWIGEFMNDPES